MRQPCAVGTAAGVGGGGGGAVVGVINNGCGKQINCATAYAYG